MIASVVKIFLVILWTCFFSVAVLVTLPFNKGGRLFNWLGIQWGRGIMRICGIKVEVEGLENLDFSSSYIYVSNHASMFDIPAVMGYIPDQIRIVFKKELAGIPLFGWAVRTGGYIVIDRGHGQDAMRSLEKAAETIRRGASVLLFPEGTRTRTGKLQPFKRGAFNLALRAGVPVVPLTINGSYRIMPKSSLRINPGTIQLKLGIPIPTNGSEGKEAEVKLMEEVHGAIERHYVEQ
ncbi:MAG TPA: lysophospholipid acyltransferase family protein [Bacteroidota bacterium]